MKEGESNLRIEEGRKGDTDFNWKENKGMPQDLEEGQIINLNNPLGL